MPPGQSVDDLSIADAERLWRRVPPVQMKVDAETGKIRPSAAAFSPSDEMSVDIASLTTVKCAMAGNRGYGLAEFTAGDARRAGCIVLRRPLRNNRAHALVLGSASGGRTTQGQAKKLRAAAVWAYEPAPANSSPSAPSWSEHFLHALEWVAKGLARILTRGPR